MHNGSLLLSSALGAQKKKDKLLYPFQFHGNTKKYGEQLLHLGILRKWMMFETANPKPFLVVACKIC